MINDYWIITLFIGEVISLALLVYAVFLGLRIAFKWDAGSSSTAQLGLERRSYLVSTLVMYVASFEMLSLWLFVIIINDHLPPLIRGAMCGTGSLNANEYGWIALILKIAESIVLALWLVAHRLDGRFPEYPLTREKFVLLLLVAPLVLATVVLQTLYFLNINPNIITTCCSITFSSINVGSHRGSLQLAINEDLIVRVWYGMLVVGFVFDALIVFSERWLRTVGPVVVPITGIVICVVTVFAIVNHYAKYIYGMPSHRCPFDMLWSEYYYVGYLIYGLLMISTISSISTAVMKLARKKKSIQAEATILCKTAAIWNAVSLGLLFLLLQGIALRWKPMT